MKVFAQAGPFSALILSIAWLVPAYGAQQMTAASPTLSAPLPEAIKARGKLIMGVKCDYPPIGYVDANGKNVGFEIDVVREFATLAFGSPDAVDLQCVTGPNRIPYITSDRVDGVAATLSWTPDRAKVIAFSEPYFDSGIQILVPKDSPIKDWPDIKGKTITTTRGGGQSIWLQKCMPDVHQMLFDDTSDSLSALKQGRAIAFPQDSTLLMGIITKDPSLKIVGHIVARGPSGVGVKIGNEPLAAWFNAAIAEMTKQDFFWKTLTKWVPGNSLDQFKTAVPRPGQTPIKYNADIYVCD